MRCFSKNCNDKWNLKHLKQEKFISFHQKMYWKKNNAVASRHIY